ncbi:hypothetical protein E1A91_D05G099600v1 [Gossypium mustelinum]|uniref:Protein kinase domain-containing protein n=1 Tax=Gossypium mustelinum TaxID=34275 RepID=A0A5D2UW39_GOSMU|nr:hypothetical protein E1A91_D05G099600v1 [Gossypium mustelinum]
MSATAVLRSIPILMTFLMLLEQFALSHSQVENQFIFNGFNGANRHHNGIAEIQPNGLLQLTNTSKRQIGRAFFPFPLKFNNSSSNISDSLSFSANFVFAIVPEETDPSGGHGIAFTIAPTMELTGAISNQYLGLFNSSSNGLSSNHVFAIELDTVQSPEFGDINGDHVGIDVNNLRSLESAPTAYFVEDEGQNRSLELLNGNPMQLWIDSRKWTMVSSQYILGWSFSKIGKAQSLDYSKLPSLPRRKSKANGDLQIIIPVIVVIALLVTIFGGAFAYVVRRKTYVEIREDWEKEYSPQRFSFKDLYKATEGFKEKELLGRRGFGKVYRGVLPSSSEQVAVKRISHNSEQGMKEFVSEILLGYCRRKGELLLVYEYMPNGSLDKFLFNNSKPNLSWDQRFQILKGVASALLYLHEEWEQVVLHRDVKASNILLDANFNGRLGDFGLARLCDHGYIAPELTRTGKATTSTDVFAFGIFILELASGRKPLEPQLEPEETFLTDRVLELWKAGAILDAADPRLEGEYVADEMDTRQMVQYLDGIVTLPGIPLDGVTVRTDMMTVEHTASTDCVVSLATSYEENSVSANSCSSPCLS